MFGTDNFILFYTENNGKQLFVDMWIWQLGTADKLLVVIPGCIPSRVCLLVLFRYDSISFFYLCSKKKMAIFPQTLW